jgi:hypothetical protein
MDIGKGLFTFSGIFFSLKKKKAVSPYNMTGANLE